MVKILIGTGVLGGLSLVLGLLLTLCNKVFAVPGDARLNLVREALPGTDCGVCGFPGCDGLPDAILAGDTSVDACQVGGTEVTSEISDIMGPANDDPFPRRLK